MTIIDITVGLARELPAWPDSTGFRIESDLQESGNGRVRNSTIHADLHSGTHVDAPSHYLSRGATVDELDLARFVGPADVIDVDDAAVVSAEVLDGIGVGTDVERLLIRSRNSAFWPSSPDFREDYVALNISGARWCIERGLKLVGIDYLSIQQFDGDPAVHRLLLREEVGVIEGLRLEHVAPGRYELLCLPIPVVGAEAAPVRAVLRPEVPV